jgi:hypothetical protein
MAERRMYTKKITDSDAFTEMPSASQALYFHLNQGADDDGFNNQIQMAMFKAHASTDDLKILLAKNFIIRFESGVIVIKHWRMHNTIRKDRYTPTNFQEELEQLGIKENGAYTQWLPSGCQMVATGKDSIGKDSIDKDNIVIGDDEEKPKPKPKKKDKPKTKSKPFVPPTVEEIETYCKKRNNNVDAQKFFDYYDAAEWCDKNGDKVKSWKQKVITWEGREKSKPKPQAQPEQGTGNIFVDMLNERQQKGGFYDS